MTKYHTMNKLGSTDPRDLYDNAQNFDAAVNDTEHETWKDRFGRERKTLKGYDSDFQQFLINSGYQNIGDYSAGLEIAARNQIFWKDGELYRVSASVELPYTTTGDWSEEEGLFVAVGDQSLRQELQSSDGADMVGYKSEALSNTLKRVGSAITPQMFDDNAGVAGHDSTWALQEVARVSFEKKIAAWLPSGIYDYSDDIIFKWDTFGDGRESTILNKTAPATVFHTGGRFEQIAIKPIEDAILDGDTSDGFVMTGIDRKWVDVHSEYHGGHAIVFEGGNLSRIVARGMRSGGHGFYAPANESSGDNRALYVWIEATSNGRSGFVIGKGSSTARTAAHWVGMIVTQNNGENGYILEGINHSFKIYSENNAVPGVHGSTLGSSQIFSINYSTQGVVDETSPESVNIWSYSASNPIRSIKKQSMEALRISNYAHSGGLELLQTGAREYELNAIGSSAAQKLTLGDTLSIGRSDGAIMSFRSTPPPSNATAVGRPGYWALDGSYLYLYTGDGASNHSWRRVAHSTW